MLKPRTAGVLGFFILFSFSFYGLHVATDTSTKAKETAVAVEKNADKEAKDFCEAQNESRSAAHLLAEHEARTLQILHRRLQGRFLQAGRLNPPTTERALRAQAAGEKFFQDFVTDTKELTDQSVRQFKEQTPIVKC